MSGADPDVKRLMLAVIELTGGIEKHALFVLLEALMADRTPAEACEVLEWAKANFEDIDPGDFEVVP